MSCQVKLSASLSDVPAIKRHLFPTDDLRGGENWLQQCQISVCPTGELIVLANGKRLAVLSAKWDSVSGLSQFQLAYAGVPEEEDAIRAVLCLPIVGQSQSSHVGPDWTCLVIGYESGYVRFYTENCNLLLYEQLHDDSVCSLKCQSQHSPRPDINTELRVEELYVIYNSCVCVVAGSVLFSSLRTARSQLAVVLARDAEFTPLETTSCPRKWGFQEQATINDASVVGLELTNTYDHLLTASTLSGFDARYRAMPPHNTLVLAAGAKPFLAFHYALEGGAQPVLSDVAKAVASKLKSALPGWLTGAKPQPDKQNTTALQLPEPMGCRFGLCDIRRQASTFALTPDHKFAAISDSVGRVLLVDLGRGVVVRMLKGYREAQCAFVQVLDEKRSKYKGCTRVAVFLVVYSGKKETLEVFAVQKARKIVTFKAAKHSKLLYVDYSLMGFTGTTKSRYVCPFTCVLMDADGNLKEIVIPFHFALSEKNSTRVRDLHLYKRLKQLIKTGETTAEAVNTCKELKTAEVKLQCVEMLMACKEIDCDTLLTCAQHFLEAQESDGDLEILCKNLEKLLQFYLFVTNVDLDLDKQNGNNEQEVLFTMPVEQTKSLQKLLDLNTILDNQKASEIKVSFKDESDFPLSKFLSIFKLNSQNHICLNDALDETIFYKTSAAIYKNYISNDSPPNPQTLKTAIFNSAIVKEDLFKLLLLYWVNRPLNEDVHLEKEMRNLSCVVFALAQTADEEEVAVEYNSTSVFWSKIREMLEDSARPFPALTAAIVCQSVTQRIEHERDMQTSDDSTEVWEKLTQENCQWDLLIGKLEDISLLNIILSSRPTNVENKLPRLKTILDDVSLKYVLEKGRGSVSELVAKWLTCTGVDPENLLINDLLSQQQEEIVIDNRQVEKTRIEAVQNQQIFHYLGLLKEEFPYSLSVDVLLCNMSWEYAVAWLKNIEELVVLEAATTCLKYIGDVHIKRGLLTLVWNTHLRVIFESCCKLINKAGRLPKPKLCQQDTKLSDAQIVQFLGISTEFLRDFLDVLRRSANAPQKQLHYEPIFENGGQPLTELALQQSPVNYELLHLHYELSLALLLMATYEIKHSKPLNNLFTTSTNSVFFADITKRCNFNPHNNTDERTLNSQTQYLFKIINASIETITVNNGAVFSAKHVNAMGKCVVLAQIWNVDVDLLRRYQVVQLFGSGFDSLGVEVLPAVVEKREVGVPLLKIAGKRLAQFLASTEGLAEKMGALSPALTNYLEGLNGEWCSPSSLDSIIDLARLSLQCNAEQKTEYKLNNLLLDACLTLKDLEQC